MLVEHGKNILPVVPRCWWLYLPDAAVSASRLAKVLHVIQTARPYVSRTVSSIYHIDHGVAWLFCSIHGLIEQFCDKKAKKGQAAIVTGTTSVKARGTSWG